MIKLFEYKIHLETNESLPLCWKVLSTLFVVFMLLAMTVVCASCQPDKMENEEIESRPAVICLKVTGEEQVGIATRAVNENDIHDLHILIYDNKGELIGQQYSTSNIINVNTHSATNCTIYAIANTGNKNLFSNGNICSENYLKNLTLSISTWNELTNGTVLPMTGCMKQITITEGMNTPSKELAVNRVTAKVTLNVSIATGSGISISNYRIYGIPKQTYYILRPLDTETNASDTQASRADDASKPITNSHWINSGELSASSTSISTTFYMFENRAGINSSITNQKNKIKTNAPGYPADSSAYIIIHGKAPGYQQLTWKIYLGATNTANFNIKRNCSYTYKIKLTPTTTDTRITYKKSSAVWAGSNIYWDGSKLTFDETIIGNSNLKQGISFRWGSLIGIPCESGRPSNYYIPTYNTAFPQNSTWAYKSYNWDSIECFYNEDTGNTNASRDNAYLNNAARNTDINYQNYKGDICQYLSKTGAVKGNWRMPTSREFGEAANYTKYGNYELISSVNIDGTTIIPSYYHYSPSNGKTTNFTACGWRTITGTMTTIGRWGYYWSSSAYSGSTNSYCLDTYATTIYPAYNYSRQYAFSIRCVQY